MQKENKRQLAQEYLDESYDSFEANKLSETIQLVQQALLLSKEANAVELHCKSLNLMGVIYASTGNETMAIDYYLDGLGEALDYHLDNLVVLFYNNIGSRYQELNEYEKALYYFKKADESLQREACKKEERYELWCLITYMNMINCYREGKKFDEAKHYLALSEDVMKHVPDNTHEYTYLISKCRLYWEIGEKQYIYDNLDTLMESGIKDRNASDYIQDMQDLCVLLKNMKEYDKWAEIITIVEHYAKEQNTVYFDLIQTEMWMDYYKTMDEMNKYIHLCVDHAELYRKQKEITDRELAAAIDIKIELREKEAERKRAVRKSTIDQLTGIGNRYMLNEDVKKILKQAVEKQTRVTIGVLDIDFFKKHNDTYGHIQGDQCLKRVAEILKTVSKPKGRAYRFGGDEFVLICNDCDSNDVASLARDIQTTLEVNNEEGDNSEKMGKITISQGYYCFTPSKVETGATLLERADKALYYVKNSGRNGFHIIEE